MLLFQPISTTKQPHLCSSWGTSLPFCIPNESQHPQFHLTLESNPDCPQKRTQTPWHKEQLASLVPLVNKLPSAFMAWRILCCDPNPCCCALKPAQTFWDHKAAEFWRVLLLLLAEPSLLQLASCRCFPTDMTSHNSGHIPPLPCLKNTQSSNLFVNWGNKALLFKKQGVAGVGFSSTAPDQLSGSIHPLSKAVGYFPVTDQWNLQWNLSGRTLLGGFLSNEHFSVRLGAPRANVYPPLYPASHTAIIISGMQSNHLFFVRKAAGLKAKELLLAAVCNNLRQAVFLVGLLQSFYCNAEKNHLDLLLWQQMWSEESRFPSFLTKSWEDKEFCLQRK